MFCVINKSHPPGSSQQPASQHNTQLNHTLAWLTEVCWKLIKFPAQAAKKSKFVQKAHHLLCQLGRAVPCGWNFFHVVVDSI